MRRKEPLGKKWSGLSDPTFCNGKKSLFIWDFDGTLFNSPSREEGEALYLAGTGKTWPFDGWWGRLETLLPPIIPDPPPRERLIEEVYQAYVAMRADPDAFNVLMTGRPFKNRKRVKEILTHFGISFDEEYYRGTPGLHGNDTFDIKAGILETRLMHNQMQRLEIWEDRAEHVSRFVALFGRLKSKYRKTLSTAVVHDVINKVDYSL